MKVISLVFPLLSLLIGFFVTIPKSTAFPTFLHNYCSFTTVDPNSKYADNHKSLLRSLSSNAATSPTGFHSTAVQNTTNDAVYGLFLCRGDQNTSSCSDCVAAGVQEQPKICSRSTWGIIWYNECMIRYDNRTLIGKMDTDPYYDTWNDHNITGNHTGFGEFLGDMLRNLAAQAANDQSGKKYATKILKFTENQTLYALDQCTPDLSTQDCYQCLKYGNMVASQGARLLMPSCNVRYEIYPFFDTSYSLSLGKPNSTAAGDETGSIPTCGRGKMHQYGSPKTDHKKKESTHKLIAIVIPFVLASLLLFGFCFFLWKRKAKWSSNDDKDILTLQYEVSTIKAATNNFSAENKLGAGGFGDVYKGRLQNGQEIAVKRLSPKSQQGIPEFKTEVLLVAKLQHRNLVRLLGFCVTEEEKLLIYEYLPHSSLDLMLFDHGKDEPLVWQTRYKIIDGIAKGLHYLHEDSRYKIVHRDLKPSNILLDEDMSPKISDFGLAKLVEEDEVQAISMRIIGTRGYMAPEYLRTGQFSVMSDVYSFGVLVLEVVSGRRIRHSLYISEDEEGLLQSAWRLWHAKEPLSLLDPRLCGSYSVEEATRCIHIGLLCVQEDATKRPTMALIVSMLKQHSNDIPQPPKTSFLKSASTLSSEQSAKEPQHVIIEEQRISLL